MAAESPTKTPGETFAVAAGYFARLTASMFADVSPRAVIWLGALLVLLLIAPWLVNDYLMTVLIVVLYFAYTG